MSFGKSTPPSWIVHPFIFRREIQILVHPSTLLWESSEYREARLWVVPNVDMSSGSSVLLVCQRSLVNCLRLRQPALALVKAIQVVDCIGRRRVFKAGLKLSSLIQRQERGCEFQIRLVASSTRCTHVAKISTLRRAGHLAELI
jgi:hypothetical protein